MKFASAQDYREWVASQDWYQTMSLSHGIVTPGSVRTDLRESLLAGIDLRGRRVLDVGCNSGQYCLWAKKHGAGEVIGIDLAENRLAQARRIAENENLEVDFRRLSLMEAPELGRFDVVFCFAVLTEIPDFSGAVDALKRLVGGRCILELDLAKPLVVIPRLRPPRRDTGWGELRRNKRGDWIVSPTVRTLRAVFGDDFVVKKHGRGIRYDVVHVRRKDAGRGTGCIAD